MNADNTGDRPSGNPRNDAGDRLSDDLGADAGAAPADDTYKRGVAMVTEIYQGEVPALPEGTMAFNDVMMRSLFAEVWDRDVLSIRDRRLLIMGVIAARGSIDVWKLQAQSALRRGELTPDELRETLIALAPYAGYPMVAPLIGPCEAAINDWTEAAD